MKYLLDTNICIYAVKKHPREIAEKLAEVSSRNTVSISAISVAEMEYGAAKSGNPKKNREALMKFLGPFDVAPFREEAAAFYGAVRAELEAAGKPIGGNDMLIASQALAGDFILVTNNVREFSRVSGLKVENWV